ncbi:MAG: MmcQ/YjbR family DNA-binding protein [Muribaculaceae bacterium]|nr:MmcQ/YjbR family DNA-binding protein [Muribaculaceae bacterium]
MDVLTIREYCLSLPYATEDTAFGEDNLLFRVCGKIFACLSLDGDNRLALKCNPDYALELREQYYEIEPAWHWNKKYWNQLFLNSDLSKDLVLSLVRHSYSEAAAKLTKKQRSEFPAIADVK